MNDKDKLKIVGAFGQRRPMDFYPTPREATVALLLKIKDDLNFIHSLGGKIWEPACGEGHIVDVLKNFGYNAVGTDIQTGQDFMTTSPPDGTAIIITNPPFSQAEQFIRRANSFHIPFVLLLKSQYWHSAKRYELFNNIRPTAVFPLTWRTDFTGEGASMMDVMWVYWKPTQTGYTFYEPLRKPKIVDWR